MIFLLTVFLLFSAFSFKEALGRGYAFVVISFRFLNPQILDFILIFKDIQKNYLLLSLSSLELAL